MKRTATVIWKGSGKEGEGKITTQSKVLVDADFAYDSRFENAKGTNPEELLAAAHASCFSMKLSFVLLEAGFKASSIETNVTVALEGGIITSSHIKVSANVEEITQEQFKALAEKTKKDCPISKALNLKIEMEATLKNASIKT